MQKRSSTKCEYGFKFSFFFTYELALPWNVINFAICWEDKSYQKKPVKLLLNFPTFVMISFMLSCFLSIKHCAQHLHKFRIFRQRNLGYLGLWWSQLLYLRKIYIRPKSGEQVPMILQVSWGFQDFLKQIVPPISNLSQTGITGWFSYSFPIKPQMSKVNWMTCFIFFWIEPLPFQANFIISYLSFCKLPR